MTYFDVQLYVAAPMVAAALHMSRRRGLDTARWWSGVALLALIASVWTTPWDNWMVATGVWGYPPDSVLGTVYYIPVEEQAFFVLQTVLTGAFLGLLIGPKQASAARRVNLRVAATAGALGLVAAGIGFFLSGYLYLGSMFVWFGIPLMVQFAWGADQLPAHLRSMLPAIIVPTIFLCHLDSLAVSQGTWFFDQSVLCGLRIGSLPVEEVLFFGLTNVLLVVGLTLCYEFDTTRLPRFGGLTRSRERRCLA